MIRATLEQVALKCSCMLYYKAMGIFTNEEQHRGKEL
jgi:hypothetical protein